MSTEQKLKQLVVGFAFDESADRVLLIKKTHPDFLKGLWTGPGGKVENGEDLAKALSREFKEETALIVPSEDWSYIDEREGPMGIIHFFSTTTDINEAETTTEEVVRPHLIERLRFNEDKLAPFTLEMINSA